MGLPRAPFTGAPLRVWLPCADRETPPRSAAGLHARELAEGEGLEREHFRRWAAAQPRLLTWVATLGQQWRVTLAEQATAVARAAATAAGQLETEVEIDEDGVREVVFGLEGWPGAPTLCCCRVRRLCRGRCNPPAMRWCSSRSRRGAVPDHAVQTLDSVEFAAAMRCEETFHFTPCVSTF